MTAIGRSCGYQTFHLFGLEYLPLLTKTSTIIFEIILVQAAMLYMALKQNNKMWKVVFGSGAKRRSGGLKSVLVVKSLTGTLQPLIDDFWRPATPLADIR